MEQESVNQTDIIISVSQETMDVESFDPPHAQTIDYKTKREVSQEISWRDRVKVVPIAGILGLISGEFADLPIRAINTDLDRIIPLVGLGIGIAIGIGGAIRPRHWRN